MSVNGKPVTELGSKADPEVDSIRVNNQWPLVFRWDGSGGEAGDVYLDDHSY